MKQYINDKEELMEMLRYYRAIKKHYSYSRSGNSISIKIGHEEFWFSIVDGEDTLPLNQLSFISKVKKHIFSNDLHKIKPNYKNQDDIKYFDYSEKFTGEIDGFSLDIKSAYWMAGLKNGFICPALFTEGETKDKRIRLASLGTFGKQKWNYTYNGKQEQFIGQEKPQYPHVFFNNAQSISEVMQKCQKAINGDFIMYWVDGIQVKTEKAVNICMEIISEAGYNYKPIELNTIKREKNCILVGNKPFFLPS